MKISDFEWNLGCCSCCVFLQLSPDFPAVPFLHSETASVKLLSVMHFGLGDLLGKPSRTPLNLQGPY